MIDALDASAYTVPTDSPEADGSFAWSSTTITLVEARSGECSGIGWTYGPSACVSVVSGLLGPAVCGLSPLDAGAAWIRMVAALRNAGRPGIAGMALSAVDCALWDLKARMLGQPLHRLLGAVRDEVPVYGSGGFTTYDDGQLTDQLTGWVHDQRIPRVKIKIGEAWGTNERRDLERVRRSREVIGPDTELYVDANGGYRCGQAVRLGRALDELGVLWFEEPVSSDDLEGLAQVRRCCGADVAAGEYGYDLVYFRRMCVAEAVDCVQVDVTRCGGITELQRIAALAAAFGLEVSGHCAPHLHADVLAAIPNLRHLEWFHDHVRIEGMLFDGTLDPAGGAIRPRDAAGHGLAWRAAAADPYRVA